MLNSELQRWMVGNPFQINGFIAENIKEWTNRNIFFPIVALTSAKKTREVFELHMPSSFKELSERVDFLIAKKNVRPNADSNFPIATLSSVKKTDDIFERQTPSQGIGAYEFIDDSATKENAPQDEDLTFPVAALSTVIKENEASSQHVEPMEDRAEEIVSENGVIADESKETVYYLPSEPRLNFLPISKKKLSDNEPVQGGSPVAKEEVVGDSKSDISIPVEPVKSDFNIPVESVKSDNNISVEPVRSDINIPVEPVRSDISIPVEPVKSDNNISVEPVKSDTSISDEPAKSEEPTLMTDEELLRSYEDKKARAAVFAEEYRESRKLISEQNGKIKKNHLVWIGAGFISVLVLTISTVLFIYSGVSENQAIDNFPPVLISENKAKNADVPKIEASDSVDMNSIGALDAASGLENVSMASDEVVASSLTQSTSGATTEKLSTSEDNTDQTVAGDTASSGSGSMDTIVVDRTDDTERMDDRDTVNIIQKVAVETSGSTITTKIPPIIESARVSSGAATGANNVNLAPPVKFAQAYSPKDIISAHNRVLSDIKSERYFEAINLSKSNLERNPYDRLSFFTLGIALYATSDYTGATRAFIACLRLERPNLPIFLVEKFDSAESLENLFINYPGVESLIRSVELNPLDKSLYLNIFLSNLKSDKPRENSEIYYTILSHAEKRGLRKAK